MTALPIWVDVTAMAVNGFFAAAVARNRGFPIYGTLFAGLLVALGGGAGARAVAEVASAAAVAAARAAVASSSVAATARSTGPFTWNRLPSPSPWFTGEIVSARTNPQSPRCRKAVSRFSSTPMSRRYVETGGSARSTSPTNKTRARPRCPLNPSSLHWDSRPTSVR